MSAEQIVPDDEQTDPADGAGAGGPALVLVGVPGSGVSTAAAGVGERLGLPVRDTDTLVEHELGAPVHELVIDLGEEPFRAAETRVATAALARPGVVALGSGALSAVAERLAELRAAGTHVVHLRITPGTAMRRLGLSGLGSVALPNTRATWTTMAKERDARFAAAATFSIDTTTLTPDQVLDAVIQSIG